MDQDKSFAIESPLAESANKSGAIFSLIIPAYKGGNASFPGLRDIPENNSDVEKGSSVINSIASSRKKQGQRQIKARWKSNKELLCWKDGEWKATKDLKLKRKICPQCKHYNIDSKTVKVFECSIILESEMQSLFGIFLDKNFLRAKEDLHSYTCLLR